MTKLYQYQEEGVQELIKHNGRALLADDMGLGKTIQALEYLRRTPEALPAVVVCPASLKWVWEHQAKLHIKMPSEVIEGTKPKKGRLLTKHNLIIINYDILGAWLEHLKEIKPKTLIIDECHYIKSRSAKRTKNIKQISKNVEHLISISGTPLVNRPAELYTTLNILWPKVFHSFWSFAFKFCKPSRRPWGWEFKGADNLDELHTTLKELGMIRRLKQDVLQDLPDKTREIIQLPLSKKSEYTEAVNDFIGWLQKQSAEKAFKAKKAEKLVKMGYLKRLASQLKMKSVIEWVDNFLESSDEKLVLFCTHKAIIKKLHEKYQNISVVVDGGTSNKKRKWAVDLFQNKKKVRLFIGNIRAAGVGITLTAASKEAFVELDFVPGNVTQCEDRVHRIGQKGAVTIYYLIAKDTIEEYLCEIIQNKQKVVSNVLDGTEKTNKWDIYSQLENKLLGKG
jgi:SWI/SNF-related matrix-associated actin-dependent regulator 1 of chromatin subfamily A